MRSSTVILLFLTFASLSQPLVHQEPHHIPVIENRFARVLNVIAKRGDTTQFHIHQNDIAYFTIKGSKLWLEELNEDAREVVLSTGWVGSDLTHSETHLVHRFANVGDSDFQLIALEVLSNKFSDKPFSKLGTPLHENERFSIQKVGNVAVTCDVPFILIELSKSGEIEALDMIKAKQVLPPGERKDSSQMIIIQFK